MKYQYGTEQPYIASYVVLRNNDGYIALVLRENTGWRDGFYGLPSGKVERNETFSACAIREAKEEVDIDVKPEDLQHALTMQRLEKEETNWIDVFFVAKKWLGEPRNAEPQKHRELLWVAPDALPENMVPNVRDALEQINKGNIFREYGWEEA